MKKIFKLLSIVILLFSFTINAEAQVKHNKKERKEMVKQLHLTKPQKQQMKSFHKSTKQQSEAIINNTYLTEQQKKAQLAQLKNEKQQKLEAILTPEQKQKMKQLKKDQPRRGVTNMPNERTAK